MRLTVSTRRYLGRRSRLAAPCLLSQAIAISLLFAQGASAEALDASAPLQRYQALRSLQVGARAASARADHLAATAADRNNAILRLSPAADDGDDDAPEITPEDPAYWHTDEFTADWGLGAINADAAYARGLSGQGVRLGVFDSGSGLDHDEFAGKDHHSLRIGDLLPDGTRCSNTTRVKAPYNCFASDGDQVAVGVVGYDEDVPDDIRRIIEAGRYVQVGARFQTHGTHVAGTIAANRDGKGMHGVSFGADLSVAKLFFDTARMWMPSDYGYRLVSLGYNGPDGTAVADMYEQMNADGVRAINHSWGRANEPDTLEWLDMLYGDKGYREYFDSFVAGSRNSGLIQVWAAGNSEVRNQSAEDAPIAGMYATLPRAFAEVEPYWLSVVNVNQDLVLSDWSHRCGYSANWCVAAPGTAINSTVYGNDSTLSAGIDIADDGSVSIDVTERMPTYAYGLMSGTSMAAPHVTGALGLLMERFPYLDNAQIRDVLLTTATDLGDPGVDDVYGWGLINLAKGIDGYGSLRVDTDVVMDAHAGGLKVWEGDAWDDWRNDIGGPGRLTKSGAGWLRLSGSNSFNGALVRAGTLELSGANALTSSVEVEGGQFLLSGSLQNNWLNQHAGETHVTESGLIQGGGINLYGGTLLFDGTLAQGAYHQLGGKARVENDRYFTDTDIDLQAGVLSFNGVQEGGSTHVGVNATLKGVGTLGSTTVEGIIAPGNSIGTLTINGDYVQTATATYFAELAPGSRSDQLHVTGNATIAGTLVALPEPGIYYLGEQFNFLRVEGELTGSFVHADFTAFSPFLKFELTYGETVTAIDVVRGQPLASTVHSGNQHSIAAVADALPITQGLPKPLTQLFPEQVGRALDGLSGELYAATPAALAEASRLVRDAMTARLLTPPARGSEGEDAAGAWVQLLTGSGTLTGDASTARTRSDSNGLLVGADREVGGWRLGAVAGLGHTDIKQGEGRNAQSKADDVHWGLYAGRRWGGFGLRTGLAFASYKIESTRTVSFAGFRDAPHGFHDAHSRQAFVEASYRFGGLDGGLEPYLQVARVDVDMGRIGERGGAAALQGGVNDTRSTVSTAGLRFDKGLKAASQQHAWLHVNGGVGYRHVSGDRRQSAQLGWGSSDTFTVTGAPLAKGAAKAELGLSVWLTPHQQLDVRYSGQVGDDSRDNAVNARWSIQF